MSSEGTIRIPLRDKYVNPGGPKKVKNAKGGNGKRATGTKVSWKKGTGLGAK